MASKNVFLLKDGTWFCVGAGGNDLKIFFPAVFFVKSPGADIRAPLVPQRNNGIIIASLLSSLETNVNDWNL